MQLINKKNNQVIVKSIKKAEGFLERTQGLLNHSSLDEDHSLWIPYCKSIHTFFMKFPIDVLFVDKNMNVTSLFHSVPSSRILFGGLKSDSVFEMQANKLKNYDIQKGDQLYVGH